MTNMDLSHIDTQAVIDLNDAIYHVGAILGTIRAQVMNGRNYQHLQGDALDGAVKADAAVIYEAAKSVEVLKELHAALEKAIVNS